ncbi:hypothetical protein AB4Z10_04635 [Bosea sp. RAF48]|uniref:hypothetical protein n=1 Tax=Bosea sp. RAF48 TaxID=3237480 RepID=UPI003F8DE965
MPCNDEIERRIGEAETATVENFGTASDAEDIAQPSQPALSDREGNPPDWSDPVVV